MDNPTIGYATHPELVWIARKGTHYHTKDCPQVVNNPEYFAIERLNIRRYKTTHYQWSKYGGSKDAGYYKPCPSCLTEEYRIWLNTAITKLARRRE